jgi:hypothetical protein
LSVPPLSRDYVHEIRGWTRRGTMYEELRPQLVALAIKKGLIPADAEDAASEALEALLKRQPKPANPAAYAKGALSRLISGRWRQSAAEMRKVQAVALGAEDTVSSPEADQAPLLELAALAGAMEQMTVWGNQGSTHLVTKSVQDIDRDGIMKDAAFMFQVVDLLPYTRRHRLNKAEELRGRLRGLLDRCGYRFEKRAKETHRLVATSQKAARQEPRIPASGKKGASQRKGRETVLLVSDWYLTRGMMLAGSLCPRLTFEERMEIAWKARVAVFGLPADRGPTTPDHREPFPRRN